jgi:hypothetical protein
MKNMLKTDPSSTIIMVITLVLFIAAVFTTGFTHDLLLESAVFLVSVKLIIMNFKQQSSSEEIKQQLEDIKSLLHADKK